MYSMIKGKQKSLHWIPTKDEILYMPIEKLVKQALCAIKLSVFSSNLKYITFVFQQGQICNPPENTYSNEPLNSLSIPFDKPMTQLTFGKDLTSSFDGKPLTHLLSISMQDKLGIFN